MQRTALNQEIQGGATQLHHTQVDARMQQPTTTTKVTEVDITLRPEAVQRENVITTREYIKDELVVQQTNETIRQAPVVREKHVFHEQPVLQERHIYKEIPVVERTVVHEQPSLVTRDVIHELPVQIKQSAVITEQQATKHEVQKVQHELRVEEDKSAPKLAGITAGLEQQTLKDKLVVQQTNETVREAPLVNEHHVFHEKPVLQEHHIYKEVPVVDRTVVHEQPSLTTRDVIHELPVQIKESAVVTETAPVKHEVQKVQHELRVVEEKPINMGATTLTAEKPLMKETTTTTTTTKTCIGSDCKGCQDGKCLKKNNMKL